jgi:hypothetical protein
MVELMERRAAQRKHEGLQRQRGALHIQLQREFGRYLVCLDNGTADLNGLLYQ